jgi:hypothetical protein
MKIHPGFQISPLPIGIEKQEAFEVLDIINSRINCKKLEYLVQCQNTTSVKGLENLSPILLMPPK